MISPPDLLTLAHTLAHQSPSNDAVLRRAISTAYYALFHTILVMAADELIGSAHRVTAAYGLVYRGFAHARMKTVCEGINKNQLGPKYAQALHCQIVHQDIRDFADLFVGLQQRRHDADYNPHFTAVVSDAISAHDDAQTAIQALTGAPALARKDVLALLLLEARS